MVELTRIPSIRGRADEAAVGSSGVNHVTAASSTGDAVVVVLA